MEGKARVGEFLESDQSHHFILVISLVMPRWHPKRDVWSN